MFFAIIIWTIDFGIDIFMRSSIYNGFITWNFVMQNDQTYFFFSGNIAQNRAKMRRCKDKAEQMQRCSVFGQHNAILHVQWDKLLQRCWKSAAHQLFSTIVYYQTISTTKSCLFCSGAYLPLLSLYDGQYTCIPLFLKQVKDAWTISV